MRTHLLGAFLVAIGAGPSFVSVEAQDIAGVAMRIRDAFPPDVTAHYAVEEDLDLEIFGFLPDEEKYGGLRPAVLFFFGGGWRQGSPLQFFPFCKALSARGMACFAPDYRVLNRQGTDAPTALEDARSAIRWLQAAAGDYRVDPARIYAGGGSAGGHLAAAAGIIPAEDGSLPGLVGLLLFNPALDLSPAIIPERVKRLFRGAPLAYSPLEFVKPALPPAWIAHGEADGTVPIDTARRFCSAMVAVGNQCTVHGYPGQGHGFFNYGRDQYEVVLADLLQYLGLAD